MSKIAVAIGASIVLPSAGLAAAKDRTFSGEIMDSACAKEGSHEAMMTEGGPDRQRGLRQGVRDDGRRVGPV